MRWAAAPYETALPYVPLPFQTTTRALALGLFALLLFISVIMQNLGIPNPVFRLFSTLPHFDKLGHFLLMGALNFFLLLFLLPRFPQNRGKAIVAITVLVAVVVALEELSQAFVPNRTLSLLDYLASLAGILTASFLVRI